MHKIIKTYEEAKPQIIEAVNMIAEPVVQTLSPQGGDVMFEDDMGNVNVTNDGVTIAKQISSEDPLKNKIIEAVRYAALKTNSVAGDGTTTATLLTKTAIKEGMRLLDNGMTKLELKNHLVETSAKLTEALAQEKIEVTDDEQLRNIALISSSGDEEIADHVLEVIQNAGQDGLVLIDPNNKPESEVQVEPGFHLEQPMAFPELFHNRGFSATMTDAPVLITDKRLYYEQEAETILRTALEAGHKKLVIVAADFIGKTPNFFLANHDAGSIQLMLIKESEKETLADLATYLGGEVVSEKTGSLVDGLSADKFIVSEKVFANNKQSIFNSTTPENEAVQERIASLREEIDDSEDTNALDKRLAALTSGTVTVKVGGTNPLEIQEKIFRYEDSVNAVRAAQKDGYVVGGGLTLLNLLESTTEPSSPMYAFVKKYCEASVRQIAENSGKHPDSVVEECTQVPSDGNWGYNAKTDEYCDMLDAGVIDPYKVTEMAITNSLSITKAILTSGYFIVNKEEDKES